MVKFGGRLFFPLQVMKFLHVDLHNLINEEIASICWPDP